MKILMLGWELPPHYAGGMGTVCYSLSKHLAQSGAMIDFVLPFEADFSKIDFMRVNPRPRSERSTSNMRYTYRHIQEIQATVYGKVRFEESIIYGGISVSYDSVQSEYIRKVKELVIAHEYDVIHAHDWLTLKAGILAKKLTGKPLIVHIHATEFDRSGVDDTEWGNPVIHDIEYEGMLMADRIVAVSNWTKQIIIKRYGIPPGKIDVIHNSIDLYSPYLLENTSADIYRYLRTLKSRGYKVVFNVGRHSIQKGLTGLLETARLAIDKNPKLIFLFIGGGDMHEELVLKSAELGISQNTIFTGFKNGSALRQAFDIADVFIMPSVSEPFGTTALEAVGFGTPCIVSKQSGVAEVLTGVIKIDFWDHVQMADTILSITSRPALARSLIDAGYVDFGNQSWRQAAESTKHSYHLAMGLV